MGGGVGEVGGFEGFEEGGMTGFRDGIEGGGLGKVGGAGLFASARFRGSMVKSTIGGPLAR